jgi:DNA-directed RNA polymerase subunit K/omega
MARVTAEDCIDKIPNLREIEAGNIGVEVLTEPEFFLCRRG